jgi:hypothetical protein
MILKVYQMSETSVYKGFNADLTCRDFSYKVDQIYQMNEEKLQLCDSGFHFCRFPLDVFNYYDHQDHQYGIIKASGKKY